MRLLPPLFAAAIVLATIGGERVEHRVREQLHAYHSRLATADRNDRGPTGGQLFATYEPTYDCALTLRYSPFMRDGAKWVCNPHWIAKQSDCVVLSFGVGPAMDFEVALVTHAIIPLAHCKIYAFDPTPGVGAESLQQIRRINATFMRYGIAGEPGTLHGMPLKTLATIINELHLEQRRIALLKLDAEGVEWSVFEQMQRNEGCATLALIDQILMEVHFVGGLPRTDGATVYRYRRFMDFILGCGFRLFYREHNAGDLGCSELSFVSETFLKHGSDSGSTLAIA